MWCLSGVSRLSDISAQGCRARVRQQGLDLTSWLVGCHAFCWAPQPLVLGLPEGPTCPRCGRDGGGAAMASPTTRGRQSSREGEGKALQLG